MTPTQESTAWREDAREQADSAKAALAAKGRQIARQQKNSAADELDVVGEALCRTVDQMRGDDNALVSHLAGSAGHQLRQLGRQLREKDVGTLMRDAGDYARRSPAAFLAGTVVAGFLVARFMKSSDQRPHDATGRRDAGRWRDDFPAPAADEPPAPTDSTDLPGNRHAH
jgi:hypothetical protein